jgi:AcrR family transcriptional regulator
MITEAKFKYALKEMMSELPLEEINVTALCQKCGCHRQTFYYHYQDIYDLIAAIFLNEEIQELERAKTTVDSLKAFIHYVKGNFSFLRATYNSAAKDLTDDFIFNKLNAKFVYLWTADPTISLKRDGCRSAARRFAHIAADEFGYCFKDTKLTPEKFTRMMNKFADNCVSILLPKIIALSKKEETK